MDSSIFQLLATTYREVELEGQQLTWPLTLALGQEFYTGLLCLILGKGENYVNFSIGGTLLLHAPYSYMPDTKFIPSFT